MDMYNNTMSTSKADDAGCKRSCIVSLDYPQTRTTIRNQNELLIYVCNTYVLFFMLFNYSYYFFLASIDRKVCSIHSHGNR